MSKRAVIVLGFESTGSVFVSQVVSHVLGACASFGDWSGYGYNGSLGDDLIILHRSLPFKRPKQWFDEPEELHDLFPGYELKFVICTRDLSISQISRELRFGGTQDEYRADNNRARKLFEKLMEREDCFVFSFESMVALGTPYFLRLYSWLGVDSTFEPPIRDANARYVKPFKWGRWKARRPKQV